MQTVVLLKGDLNKLCCTISGDEVLCLWLSVPHRSSVWIVNGPRMRGRKGVKQM